MKIVNKRKPLRIALNTLGCKLNQAETESITKEFCKAGYQIVPFPDVADIYIVNTCTVTHIADSKSRRSLRSAKRRNPKALVVATGCLTQRAPNEMQQIADLAIDNNDKSNLLNIVSNIVNRENRVVAPMDTEISDNKYTGRVRSFIKIQEGCSAKCSYCIVPEVRGYERSVPSSQIVEEIEMKATQGYKEVVLTGTNIDAYEFEGIGLYDLVKMILNDTRIPRIHLSSLQVNIVTPQFLALWRDRRLCRHFHMAIQSGSDTVLTRMKRRYSLGKYERAVTMVKDAIAEAAVTTDIIVGFPGETDSEFDQSYSFCQQMKFASIHVFPYSKRSGTEAANFPDQVPDKIKRTRVHRMLSLANNSSTNFHTMMLNKCFSVLWEHQRKDKDRLFTGLTDNYIRIYARNKNQIENSISTVRLTSLYKEGIFAEFINENTG